MGGTKNAYYTGYTPNLQLSIVSKTLNLQPTIKNVVQTNKCYLKHCHSFIL